MNENLNLVEILKGCPKGIKFYSTIFGEVEFASIKDGPSPVTFITKHFSFIYFTPNGKYVEHYDGECTIFPSKYQRDWSKFERFWDKPKVERFDPKTLQPFDKIIARDGYQQIWCCELFSYLDGSGYPVVSCGISYKCCVPYNEETKHLVGTKDDCPKYYKWWEK